MAETRKLPPMNNPALYAWNRPSADVPAPIDATEQSLRPSLAKRYASSSPGSGLALAPGMT